MTVLQASGPVEEAARRRRGRTGRGGTTMATVLSDQASACLDVLVDHDPPIRLHDPDPEHVHRSRVATRRFRTVVRALRPLVEGPGGREGQARPGADEAVAWLGSLGEDVRWLGQVLGHARDADVRAGYLEEACARLAPEDQAAAALVLAAARAERDQAHGGLLATLSTDRYLRTLRALEALAETEVTAYPTGAGGNGAGPEDGGGGGEDGGFPRAAPPELLWDRLARPAPKHLRWVAHKQWRSLRKAARHLSSPPLDEELHAMRIRAKRLRYVAEVAGPELRRRRDRRAASRVAEAATELQDRLGEAHDAAANEKWLLEVVARACTEEQGQDGRGPAVAALAGGQVLAEVRQAQARSRQAWPSAWDGLERRTRRSRLTVKH